MSFALIAFLLTQLFGLFHHSPAVSTTTPTDPIHRLATKAPRPPKKQLPRMNGVNFMAPQMKADNMGLQPLRQLNANWVALTPFAFMDANEPNIQFPARETHWGNRPENLGQLVKEAREAQLQIMLKPHFWIREQGWIGGLSLSQKDWKRWEAQYFDFMLRMARQAEIHQIEVLCVGVELKTAIQNRPYFWPRLIRAIRKVYSGQLTYAANWDHYELINFWHLLDFIGIDAYFPLSQSRTPQIGTMVKEWRSIARKLKRFSKRKRKPIIITEYGYRSCDFACWNQWEIEFLPDHANINLRAQVNGYQAFYQALWREKWLAGMFLWRWYGEQNKGGPNHSNYTPQNKPVEDVISSWYGM
ncbi:MAG: hypothetical protein AAF985_21660 [Bacteroidota bacterium]